MAYANATGSQAVQLYNLLMRAEAALNVNSSHGGDASAAPVMPTYYQVEGAAENPNAVDTILTQLSTALDAVIDAGESEGS